MSYLDHFRKRHLFVFLSLVLIAATPLLIITKHTAHAKAPQPSHILAASATVTATQHYEYVFPDGSMYVYDMDNGQSLVKQVSLPTHAVRGVVANPATGTLYISYGGDGGTNGTGSMLKYNLLTDSVVWTQNYSFGIDSMAISPDGTKIYMPDGAAQYDQNGTWYVLDANDGHVLGSIIAGESPHNTLVSLDGSHVYLGGIYNNYLQVADTSTDQVIKKIGPLTAGVRPFTINGRETLAFTTATGFLGFQVSDITTGKVLYTVPINGFSSPSQVPAPSHGISLSPDEKEIYVMDAPNSYVHVFDVSGLPGAAPKQVADIPLTPMTGNETPCSYDCTREGWLQHSRDGRFVYVGDAGDVIDTATRKVVANLAPLANTRKFLEIDWANGSPIFATPRLGVGYVTSTAAATPTPSASPLPGSTIAQDTFQRADQAYWGTASDGQTWGGDANSQSVFSIAGNSGQIANGVGPYNAVLGPTATDAEVLFSGSLSSFNNANLGAVLRWSDTNNWYKAYIDGSNLVVQSRVNGTLTILSTTAFAATAGTSYSLRFRAVGTNLYTKVWPTGTTEPVAWMTTVTDSSLQSGYCGLRIQVLAGITATVTSFEASTES